MDRDRAREEIKRAIDIRQFLGEPHGKQYVCPFCNSGGHGHGSSAAFHYYPETNTAACFSTACTQGAVTGRSYDVFDVAGQVWGTDFNTTFDRLAEMAGISVDHYNGGNFTPAQSKNVSTGEFGRSAGMPAQTVVAYSWGTPIRKEEGAAEPDALDFTEYYKECAARIDDGRAVTYLNGRGISLDTARRCGLGFDPEADPAGSGYCMERIIIPITPGHYVARANGEIPQKKYAKMNNKGAKIGIYNESCLYDGRPGPVFVTEGVFDALSIQEAGEKAIALNSANNAGKLVSMMREKPPTGVSWFVVCLDNDNAGQTGTQVLTNGLQFRTVANLCGPYKDPNEYLTNDRDSFLSAVKTAATTMPAPIPAPDQAQTQTLAPIPAQAAPAQNMDVLGEYFSMIGVRPETAERMGARYNESGGQIVIPCGSTAAATVPAFHEGRAGYSGSVAQPFGLDEALKPIKKKKPGEEEKPGENCIIIAWNAVDALALIDDGYRAVALCDRSAADYLISRLVREKPDRKIILSVTGATCDKIRQHLSTAGMSVYTADLCGNYGTVWQNRLHAREEYKTALGAAFTGEMSGVSDYIDGGIIDDIENYKTDIKTGFDNYDAESGGLYSGLYVVGAISSLGKTTFVHQLADQVAAAGKHVLFFSLEQSRFELVTKSIARESFLSDAFHAYSAMDIRRMKGKMNDQAAKVMTDYGEKVGNRLRIYESVFDCTAGQIEQISREYMARNGVTPVIIVDYLQVIQPEPDAVQTDIRSTVDAALTRFERFAKNTGAPVIVVSSINRQNYSAPIDFNGFKESGGIEYTADVVIGLQLEVMNAKIYQQDKKEINKRTVAEVAKTKIPRRIEAKVLKNRYGNTRFSVYFEYNPVFDTFTPCDPMSAAELSALEKEAAKLIEAREQEATEVLTL